MAATWLVSLGLVVATALAAPLAVPPDGCTSCNATTLCSTHQKEESAALAEITPKLKSKDAFERQAAVSKLAGVDLARPIGPSPEIAKLVAGMVDDEKAIVRTEAVKSLGGGMHPDVAIPAIAEGLGATMKELAKIPFGRGDWAPPGGANDDPKAAERRKQRDELYAVAGAAILALKQLPDDRSVTALIEALPQWTRWHEEQLTATVDALMDLRARKGVEAVIARIKAAPVGDTGSRWGGPDKSGVMVRDLAARSLQPMEIDPLPEWNDKEAPDWDAWFKKNQKHFPAKLGKCSLEEMRKAQGGERP